MKPITRCLVLLLAGLAGCKGQLAEVTVNLKADGSGDCELNGVRDVQSSIDQPQSTESVLLNANDVRTFDLQVQLVKARFVSINDFKIGDVGFALEKQGGASLLTVRIPATAGARWFGRFGVPKRALDLWNRANEESRKEDEARRKADPKVAGSRFEAPKPPNVLFEINLPGKVEGQVYETVPLGLSTKIGADRDERKASLSIPLAEIHGGAVEEVVWRIRYADP